mmetsp:Transcript_32347/g.35971  ORF Transcript_32347/g.35971 Transcript_32347/m.35971 type:complete len:87 (+) Transcript_32347:2075-2335(+)
MPTHKKISPNNPSSCKRVAIGVNKAKLCQDLISLFIREMFVPKCVDNNCSIRPTKRIVPINPLKVKRDRCGWDEKATKKHEYEDDT